MCRARWCGDDVQVGKMISSSMVGPMSDAGLVRELFLICIPLAAQVSALCVRVLVHYIKL